MTYQNAVLSGLSKRDVFNDTSEENEAQVKIQKKMKFQDTVPFQNVNIEAQIRHEKWKNFGSIPFSACTVTDEENRHRQALESFHKGEILSLAF